jgi:hypothetical protein
VQLRSEGGIWQVELNILISFVNFILYGKTLMLEMTTKMFKFITYIILVLLIILFFAHLTIVATEPIYLPELSLEIVVIINFLDCWWSKTPNFLLILMIVMDIIAI